MTPTDKVLGQLAAMQTFIENFPMSILDMMHGKVYTSIFDFLIDVLNACGVDTNEIVDFLLSEIYGIEESINGNIEDVYEQLKNGEISINTQNEFLQGLENGIKGVLMGLLSSIFTCSGFCSFISVTNTILSLANILAASNPLLAIPRIKTFLFFNIKSPSYKIISLFIYIFTNNHM